MNKLNHFLFLCLCLAIGSSLASIASLKSRVTELESLVTTMQTNQHNLIEALKHP